MMQAVDPVLGQFYLNVIFSVINVIIAGFSYYQAHNAANSSDEAHQEAIQVQEERNRILNHLNRVVEVFARVETKFIEKSISEDYVKLKANLRIAVDVLKKINFWFETREKKEVCVYFLDELIHDYEAVVPLCGTLAPELDVIIEDLRSISLRPGENQKELHLRVQGCIFKIKLEIKMMELPRVDGSDH